MTAGWSMLSHITPMTQRTPAAAVAFASFLAFLSTGNDADAFCRSTTCSGECARDFDNCKMEGAPLYWDTSCVSFSIQEEGSEFIDIETIRNVAAFSVVEWSERECPGGGNATMAFTTEDDVECRRAEYNDGGANANVVMFQDYKWEYEGVDNTLAKTTVTYDTETGEILDSDMEMNHAYNEFTTVDDEVVYDLQSIMTHEFGHFIGLDHTPDFSATMNAGYQEGTVELRTIEDDDIAGLCAAYPPGREAKCIPTPKGGFTSECAGDPIAEDEGGCSVASGSVAGSTPDDPVDWAWLAGLGLLALGRRDRRSELAS